MNDNASAYNSKSYDGGVVTVLPYYREFHAQIMDLVRATGWKNVNWLDTGCGTGTLAARVLAERGDVRFTLCDPSAEMLAIAEEKLGGKEARFVQVPSQELPFEGAFDVVTAVQSHHYFQPEERERAVRKCFRALREGGIFVTFENIRMTGEESDALALKRWQMFLEDHGRSPEDVRRQMERRGMAFFPITIGEHLDLLKKCGFRSADVLWASYLQAGLVAVK